LVLAKKLSDQYEHASIKAAIKYYTLMLSKAKELSNNIMTETLIDIERTIKEQSNLKTRIDDELDPLIKRAETELAEYKIYEEPLGPRGIANRYIANVLSNTVKNVNYFISQVWNYPMELVDVDITKPIDFTLPIRIRGKISPDISLCSKGQKVIINLAFRLALLIQMNALDKYPLMLDEPDEGCDPAHSDKLLEFICMLSNSGMVKQMFVINHNAPFFSGFNNIETICLSDENIVLPPKYNDHITLY
jgi:DNA repair exonuclease SbcCD ATPase subunit